MSLQSDAIKRWFPLMREVAMMKWFLDKCLEFERVDHVSFLIPEIHERVKPRKEDLATTSTSFLRPTDPQQCTKYRFYSHAVDNPITVAEHSARACAIPLLLHRRDITEMFL